MGESERNQRISDKKWAEELGKKLRGHDLVITEVSKKRKRTMLQNFMI